eukprot:g1824.t1
MAPRSVHRSRSAPVLSSLGFQHCVVASNDAGLEVYIASRQFREHGGALAKSLSEDFKEYARICGICHFLAIFRAQDGTLFQYDFGPAGGDIHVSSHNPFSFNHQRLIANDQGDKETDIKQGVPGEIREQILNKLPEDYLFVGSTHLTINDVRKFNYLQSTYYELHKNDCRHYINNLTKYTTGIDGASSFYVRERLRLMRHSLSVWNASFIWIMQGLSNVSHWPKVKATGNATAAALFALVGPRLIQGARIPPTNVQTRPIRRAAVAAVATAAVTWEELPVLRGVAGIGERITRGARGLFTGINVFLQSPRRSTMYSRGSPLHFLAVNSVLSQPSQCTTTVSFIHEASGNSLSFLATAFRRPFIRQMTSTNIGSISTVRIWRPFQSWPQNRRRLQASLPYSI